MKTPNFLSPILALLVPTLLAVAVNDQAPPISAKNQDGKVIHLSDFKGQYVLLYFYPKDDTPGCTTEACSLRDNFSKIKAMNTTVLGVSRQDEKSHLKFIAKHKLPFDLLVDTDGEIGKAFGVGTMPIVGFSKRQSFLIGPDGKILKYYKDVDPDTHTAQVLADVTKATEDAKKKN
jgi:thioredoxin-dependent peroxiredoxin